MSKPVVNQWSSGIFSCFDDFSICCLGYNCTPCLHGDTHDRLMSGGSCGPAFSYYCLQLCCLQALVATEHRKTMRAKFGLPEEPCGDCVVHCFLSPCAVCQEARELKARGWANAVQGASLGGATQQFVTTAPGQMQMAVAHH